MFRHESDYYLPLSLRLSSFHKIKTILLSQSEEIAFDKSVRLRKPTTAVKGELCERHRIKMFLINYSL